MSPMQRISSKTCCCSSQHRVCPPSDGVENYIVVEESVKAIVDMCGDPGCVKKIIIAVVIFGMLCSYAIFFVFPETVVVRLTREDGIVENLTAGFYLFASVFAYVLFFSIREANDFGLFKTSRNLCFLILGIIFFLIFGEEISWGQRIFGWTTPAFLERVNWKGETNIHNIDIFMTLSMNRLFSAFCIAYAVILPVLNSIIQAIARLLRKMSIPIVPLFMSVVFLINFILPRFLNAYFLVDSHSVGEVKEFNLGLLFLGATVWFMCLLSNKQRGVY